MAETREILNTGPVAALTTNDVNANYDGGRVVIEAQNKELLKQWDLQGVTLVLNYREDDPMREWPVSREERATRRFEIVVREVAPPADPADTPQ